MLSQAPCSKSHLFSRSPSAPLLYPSFTRLPSLAPSVALHHVFRRCGESTRAFEAHSTAHAGTATRDEIVGEETGQ
jgi:hypothetical protein